MAEKNAHESGWLAEAIRVRGMRESSILAGEGEIQFQSPRSQSTGRLAVAACGCGNYCCVATEARAPRIDKPRYPSV